MAAQDEHRSRIVEFWRAVELFSPPGIEKVDDRRKVFRVTDTTRCREETGTGLPLAECLAIAPEQYASHSRVRELVADLLRSDHANSVEVRALADKIRIGR